MFSSYAPARAKSVETPQEVVLRRTTPLTTRSLNIVPGKLVFPFEPKRLYDVSGTRRR